MNQFEAGLDAGDARFAIVAARFNAHIVDGLLDGALGALRDSGAAEERITVVRVPGAYEIPVTAQRLAGTGGFDAIIALGAVIRGDTPHFDFVAGECARGITDVALRHGLPVIFGVLTTGTEAQALARCGATDPEDNKGREAALTAIEMVNLLRRLGA